MRGRILFFLLLAFLLLFIAFLYSPGLWGDFEFDDLGNIVENQALYVSSLSIEQLRSAAFSGDAGPTGRPVTLLTFALNIFFFGIQPFYFKLVNLLIHLANVALVAVFSSLLLRRVYKLNPSISLFAGLAVAAMWGAHPLNLTSVLYIVQRMTSLSALFGFVALGLYAWLRQDTQGGVGIGRVSLVVFGVLLSLVLSLLCKESGILFVLLILWTELCVFEFRVNGNTLRIGKWSVQSIVVAVVAILSLIAAIWIIPPMISPAAFVQRDFTLVERLLTESRVIFMYLGMIFYPTLSGLSLYHDDFLISRSLFDPIQTLISSAALLVILLTMILLWNRCRMLVFALGWFFISHILESTVFSLELVHEHRNYFASIGLFCLFVGGVIKLHGRAKLFMIVLGGGVFLLYSFVTYNRSVVWSNLVDHAAFEAVMHPKSDRANYQMGRIYLKLLDSTKNKEYGDKAREYFKKASESYEPGNGAYFAQIHLAYYLKEQPEKELVSTLAERLRSLPFYNSNVGFLRALVECQLDGHCQMSGPDLVGLLASAVDNPRASAWGKSQVYLLLGRYFIESIGDTLKGEEFIRDAIANSDHAGARLMLAQVLRLQGRSTEAQEQLDQAEALDKFAVNAQWIRSERAKVKEMLDRRGNNAEH
ncbi:hypothetical protein SAMN05216189_10426 [Pseudomonas delhiensis]|uniref:Tetratricopeptide repeat-containing protein n=1 Tax=Pseudomonas delhiensis TaxID=366289 RepID=A0A239G8R4_9PSED|nr:hypothetical protein [Pseudomonas delhiensis]SDK54670.1 hypothetical protein SAMN05216189_10426 [Pseudomonas delhiensis]SNS65471.1 hypothetical protein SAMN06295949_10532 [Pseudomonas delhiensis]